MKITSTLFVILIGFLISGCTFSPKPVVVDQTRIIVPQIPETLLDCPDVGRRPNPDTASNEEVAAYIAALYSARKKCDINIDNIRAYQEAQKAIYGDGLTITEQP